MFRKTAIAAAALLLLTGCGAAGSSTAEQTTAPAETQAATEAVTTAAETTAAETTAAETTAEATAEVTTAAETEEPEQTEPEEQPAEESAAEAPAEQDDGWKAAYLDLIRGSGAKRFTLAYIDDDDTPELVLHFTDRDRSTHLDSPTLYVYKGGTVVEIGQYGENGFDYFGYLERRGIVVVNYSIQGTSQTTLYRLRNDGFLEIACEFFSNLEKSEYTMNGQPVSKEEIEELLAEYGQDQHKSTDGDYQAAEAETVLGAG